MVTNCQNCQNNFITSLQILFVGSSLYFDFVDTFSPLLLGICQILFVGKFVDTFSYVPFRYYLQENLQQVISDTICRKICRHFFTNIFRYLFDTICRRICRYFQILLVRIFVGNFSLIFLVLDTICRYFQVLFVGIFVDNF